MLAIACAEEIGAPLDFYEKDAIRMGVDENETKDVYEIHYDRTGMVVSKTYVDKMPLPNRKSTRGGENVTGSIGRLEQLTLGKHRATLKPRRMEQEADMPVKEEDPMMLKRRLEARRAQQEEDLKRHMSKNGVAPRSTGMDDRAGAAEAGDTVGKARTLQRQLGYDVTNRRHAAVVPIPKATKLVEVESGLTRPVPSRAPRHFDTRVNNGFMKADYTKGLERVAPAALFKERELREETVGIKSFPIASPDLGGQVKAALPADATSKPHRPEGALGYTMHKQATHRELVKVAPAGFPVAGDRTIKVDAKEDRIQAGSAAARQLAARGANARTSLAHDRAMSSAKERKTKDKTTLTNRRFVRPDTVLPSSHRDTILIAAHAPRFQ